MTETTTQSAQERAEQVASDDTRLAPLETLKKQMEAFQKHDLEMDFNYDDKGELVEARSYVQKVRTKKADVGRAKKEINEEAKAFIDKTNTVAKQLVAGFQTIIDRHQVEFDRVDLIEKERTDALLARLEVFKLSDDLSDDVGELKALHDEIEAIDVDDVSWAEMQKPAVIAKNLVLAKLKGLIDKAEKSAAKDAELARMKQEVADRDEADKKAQAEQDEKDRKAKTESDRIAKEAQGKLDEANRVAKEKQDEIDRLKREEWERMELQAKEDDERERQKQHEADEKERLEREKQEEAEPERLENERRENDEKHREKIYNEVVDAINANMVVMDITPSIVKAIIDGKIPHVSIDY